jgi:hypothetical protein
MIDDPLVAAPVEPSITLRGSATHVHHTWSPRAIRRKDGLRRLIIRRVDTLLDLGVKAAAMQTPAPPPTPAEQAIETSEPDRYFTRIFAENSEIHEDRICCCIAHPHLPPQAAPHCPTSPHATASDSRSSGFRGNPSLPCIAPARSSSPPNLAGAPSAASAARRVPRSIPEISNPATPRSASVSPRCYGGGGQ